MKDEGLAKFSDTAYIMKGLAILSVIFAHCVYDDPNIQRGSSIIGTIGVPVFLVLSAIFFDTKESSRSLIQKKLQRLILPWILWGTVTYIISCLSNNSPSILGGIKWIFGNYTWLYFVPVLLICFILCYICENTCKFATIFIVFASIVTNALYILGVIDKGGLITAYQNPLNWYLFFWIGRIIRYNLSKILSVVNKLQFMKIVSICLMVVLFSLYYYFVEEPGYWSVFSLLFELISIIVVYLISTNFALRIFKNIGKRSYPIYFIHMQIGMFVGNKILSIIPEINLFPILLVLLKPIMVLLISYYTIMGINKACNRLNLQFILKWFAI